MDLTDLLQIGAKLIQDNSDDATTNIDSNVITNALSSVLGGENGLDLSSIVSKLSDGNLGDIVKSWIGDGENSPIDTEQVENLLGSEKVEAFANELGVSVDSAKQALSDALPALVDKFTTENSGILDSIMDNIGGVDGLMDMASKFFKS